MFSLSLSLRSRQSLEPVAPKVSSCPAAVPFPLTKPAVRNAARSHRRFKGNGAAVGQAVPAQRIEAWRRGGKPCPEGQESQSVVGASRRLVSQDVGAAEYGGSGSARLAWAVGMGCKRAKPYRSEPAVAMQSVMPNPSIERTCPGKPGQASHLKR